jgi:SAM-dependent methyltransferase
VDASPEAITTARRREETAGFANVTFRHGDMRELETALDPEGSPFDAAVGRFILQFAPDPALVLRAAAERVRPGGLVCFQEGDDLYTWAYPNTPLWDQVREWFLRALEGAGVERRMGLRLYQTFLAAGLPAPELRLEAAIGGGKDAPVAVFADVVRAAVPVMERLGIATAAEVEPATLAERLLAETTARDGVVIVVPLIGGWARTPTAEQSRRRTGAT